MHNLIQQLRTQIYHSHFDFYEQLIMLLRAKGYEVKTSVHGGDSPNPIVEKDPIAYRPIWLSNYLINCSLDGHDIGVGITDNYTFHARATFWEKLSAQRQRYMINYYKTEWDNNVYSRFRNVHKDFHDEDLDTLLARVQKRLQASKKIEVLRAEEVAKGHGTSIAY